MGWVVSNHLIGGVTPSPQGNENPTSAPSGAFQCADRLIDIASNKDEEWVALAKHLGRDDLLNQKTRETRETRQTNRLRLRAELETVLTTRTVQDWTDERNAIDVLAASLTGPATAVAAVTLLDVRTKLPSRLRDNIFLVIGAQIGSTVTLAHFGGACLHGRIDRHMLRWRRQILAKTRVPGWIVHHDRQLHRCGSRRVSGGPIDRTAARRAVSCVRTGRGRVDGCTRHQNRA